jgi:hypothetical protein
MELLAWPFPAVITTSKYHFPLERERAALTPLYPVLVLAIKFPPDKVMPDVLSDGDQVTAMIMLQVSR